MSDFFSMVQRLHEISRDEERVERKRLSEQANPAVDSRPADVIATANILRELDAIKVTPKSVGEVKTDRVFEGKKSEEIDVEETIQTRFRDFMKSEVGQGNDLEAVNTAVQEAHTTATILSGSIGVLADSLKRQLEATKEGGVLQRMVEREGDSTKHIAKAHKALQLAAEALDAAHMYAVRSEKKK